MSSHARVGSRSAVLTGIKDVGWLLLIVGLLPLWGVMLVCAAGFLVVRQVYWWTRGNVPSPARPPAAQMAWARVSGKATQRRRRDHAASAPLGVSADQLIVAAGPR